jgi:hypothetical protein
MPLVLAVLLCLQTSDDTYTMRVYLKCEHKGNDLTWIKRSLADYDGIKNIQFDTNYDVLVLTMKSDTLLSEHQLKEALPDRYTITKIELQNLTGTVRQNKADLSFTMPAAQVTAQLEKWDEQPQWYEFISKNAKDAEGFRLNVRMEASGPAKGLLKKSSCKFLVLHADKCKVKAAAANTAAVTLKFVVDDVKDGKGLESSVKSIKGVTWVEFEAGADILSLTVKADTAFKSSDFTKVIEKKGKVAKVTIEDLTGTLRKEGSNIVLKAKGTGADYHLEFARTSNKFMASAYEKMAEKGTEVRVAGELVDSVIKVSNLRPLGPNED